MSNTVSHTENFGDFMKYLQSEKELIYRFNDLFGQTVLFNVLLTNVIITYDESANKLVITYLMIKT